MLESIGDGRDVHKGSGMSKELMYDFHYNYKMEDYPKAKLLFSDTDSFCYHIETEMTFTKISRKISGMISQIMLRYTPMLITAHRLYLV